MKKLQDLSKYVIDANKILLQNYERMYSTIPPEVWIEPHKAWLKIYESYIEDWDIFKTKFENVFENPPESGIADLTLLFKDDAVHEYNRAYKKAEKIAMPKSGCFIVTATYGSPLSHEIDIFRKYRDKKLMKNTVGRVIINCYYKYSPFYANLIKRSQLVRMIIRTVILSPMYKYLQRTLSHM